MASSIALSPPPTTTMSAVLEERGVAGGAVGAPRAGELLLAGHAELLVLGAHRQDERAGLVLVVADEDPVDPTRLVGRARRFVARSVTKRAPKPSAWSRIVCVGSGTMMPARKPG